jgi:virginiamycin B lyase
VSDIPAGGQQATSASRRSWPSWLPLATLLAAAIFWLAVVAILRLTASDSRHTNRTPPATLALPVATGQVVVYDAGPIREYGVLSAHAGLMMPAVAPNGHVWIAEMDTNRLAELDPSSGEMREYAIPGPTTAGAMGAAVDQQGGVWFTETSRGAIGVYETGTSSFSEFSTGNEQSAPNGIAIDASGNVWFTELAGAIGEFDVRSARMRQFPIPTERSAPYALALDTQGMVWFTEFGADKIGRLDPASGTIQEWSTPTAKSGPAGIAIGAGGSIWFSESNASAVGLLNPAEGQIREFPLPSTRRPSGLIAAPDGSVWLSDTSGSILTGFNPSSGAFHDLPLPTANAGIFWLAMRPNDELWAVEANLNANKLARIQLPGPPGPRSPS